MINKGEGKNRPEQQRMTDNSECPQKSSETRAKGHGAKTEAAREAAILGSAVNCMSLTRKALGHRYTVSKSAGWNAKKTSKSRRCDAGDTRAEHDG